MTDLRLFFLLCLVLGNNQGFAQESTEFAITGDTREGAQTYSQILDVIDSIDSLGFMIHTGDFVRHASSNSQWRAFFSLQSSIDVPLVPVVGNHDAEPGEDWGWEERFGDLYRVYAHGTVTVIALDSECSVSGNAPNEEQLHWLSNELAAVDTPWLIVAAHVGPYGASRGRSGWQWLREYLPDLEDAGVDLIVSGHDHLYSRGLTENGIPYLVTAGGGAPLYSPRSDRAVDQGNTVDVSVREHHYVVVTATQDSLYVEARGLGGQTFDAFEISSYL